MIDTEFERWMETSIANEETETIKALIEEGILLGQRLGQRINSSTLVVGGPNCACHGTRYRYANAPNYKK